ncbi:zinc-binding alcohol dehydrogenase [Salinisphaera sp. T31B1]|uniref:zinc-dependent alcohol dehydrogenase n=1 Tax=Salinisphaera sp. T31B1 TaxID=727963 RepID=UPI00333F92C3
MSQTTARAFWLRPPGESAILEESLCPIGDGEVEVRTRYTAVSRGTETLVYSGAVPESEYARMRAPFQAGELPGQVKHGYANVGDVTHGPDALLGRTVFCLYPHQTRYRVAAEAVIPLPESVPPERGVLAANMETALNALWDACAGPGDAITIVGAGVIGGLIAGLCAQLPGAQVELVDIDLHKACLGPALGVHFRTPEQASPGRDLVIHASATPAGLNTALSLAGFEATVLEMSWYGSRPIAVELGGAFHSQRLTLRSSQVGALSPSHRPRWDHRRRLAKALDLLADARFDALIDAEADFEDLPDVMQRLVDPADRTLCQRIRYA